MSAPNEDPTIICKKRKFKSYAGAETSNRLCKHCRKGILCSLYPSGKINEGNLRRHENACKNNPERVVKTVRGMKVGDVFGAVGSGAEFQAPENVRRLGQGSQKPLEGAVHTFPDGSSHPVVGKLNQKPILASSFFQQDIRCCADESESMMQFRVRPDLFPKIYNSDGACVIAEFGTARIEGAPAPWTTSIMRLFALNSHTKIDAHCIGCNTKIQICIVNCANGQGPCRNCMGNRPAAIPYFRSLQKYFDEKELQWTTVPDACTILANSNDKEILFFCNLCSETWTRKPNSQVQQNCGCPGCEARHRAELCAYELYEFVFPEAEMHPRGQARLEDVHRNPFDVASTNVKVVIEVMSLRYHVEAGKLPNDTDKMLAALRDGCVYIMVHAEDHAVAPSRELAWKRCVVAALRQAKENATQRMIHVRRDVLWTAYDCMRDAALAAEFSYHDIFCGDLNAHATVRLPNETLAQTTLAF